MTYHHDEARDAEIRANWQAALQGVKDGTELSAAIGWGFDDDDLAELKRLYKEAAAMQQKIIDLLEDCNFHTECRELEAL